MGGTVAGEQHDTDGDDQRAGSEDAEEAAPAISDGQRNAEGEIQRDRQAVGREDQADDAAAARLREPADNQLHVAEEDRGIEETDEEAQRDQLAVALDIDLGDHAEAGAGEADQQHAAGGHALAHLRPDDHAQTVGQRKNTLRQSGLRRIELQRFRDEGNDGGEGVPVGGQEHFTQQRQRQHADLPAFYPGFVEIR